MVLDSLSGSSRDAGAPYIWAVCSLVPRDIGALIEVQAGAPLGAVEWSRDEFIAALSNPWNERVGYLCLGLCVSVEQVAQCNIARNSVVQGSALQDDAVSNISVLNSPFVDSEGSVSGLEGHFAHTLGGFIILHVVDDEADVQHLAVDVSLNGRGGGSSLLQEALIRLAIREVKSVFLEVRASNDRAIGLYERVGFRKVGVRAGYYADEGEDAVVMKCLL